MFQIYVASQATGARPCATHINTYIRGEVNKFVELGIFSTQFRISSFIFVQYKPLSVEW